MNKNKVEERTTKKWPRDGWRGPIPHLIESPFTAACTSLKDAGILHGNKEIMGMLVVHISSRRTECRRRICCNHRVSGWILANLQFVIIALSQRVNASWWLFPEGTSQDGKCYSCPSKSTVSKHFTHSQAIITSFKGRKTCFFLFFVILFPLVFNQKEHHI